jgi:hypothetical protein
MFFNNEINKFCLNCSSAKKKKTPYEKITAAYPSAKFYGFMRKQKRTGT